MHKREIDSACEWAVVIHSCHCLMHLHSGSKSKTLVLYPHRELGREQQTGERERKREGERE